MESPGEVGGPGSVRRVGPRRILEFWLSRRAPKVGSAIALQDETNDVQLLANFGASREVTGKTAWFIVAEGRQKYSI